jgi:hypothetical protein
VNGIFQRRLIVLLASATMTLAAWKWLPGSTLDRAAFTAVAGGFFNPPWFVSGQGSHVDPWRLKVFSSAAHADPKQAPLVVSLEDDPDGFFQSSPHAPIDLAVILKNFKRLGKTKAATAVVLAWEEADPIGLAALEKAMAGFDSMVVAAPLSRGAVSSTMPPAFRRGSIPTTDIDGDAALLPIVNRIPLPGVILGGENTIAGFSVLDSENPQNLTPLIAKWEDRVVFSFPLLAVLQRLNCPVSDVVIKLGESVKLGATGRIIPIDSYGRLSLPMKKSGPSLAIPAESVVDGDESLFPTESPDTIILRDDRTNLEPATRRFSITLSTLISAIASDQGLANETTYPRLPWMVELLSLMVAISILGLVPNHLLNPSVWLLSGLCLAAPWIALGMASIWLPALALLVAISSTRLLRTLARPTVPGPALVIVEEPMKEEDPLPESSLPPEPAPTPSKAKRAPAKKAGAKKTAKKTAATKTATPRASRTKKPATDSAHGPD